MAEQKESSVLFSLKELMNIEESRIKEEQEAKRRAAEVEQQTKADAERRAREEEEARLREEEERRRADEHRRNMEAAQIEASKAAEIEKRRLEEAHRLEMQALAQRQAHEKEVAVITSQKRKGVPPAVMGVVGIVLVALIGAIIFFVSIKPATEAKEAITLAAKFATSDDPKDWDQAEDQIAIAKSKDPSNKDIVPVADKVKKKRDEAQAREDKEKADLAAAKKASDAKIAELTEKLGTASAEDRQRILNEIEAEKRKKPAFPGGGGGGAKPAPAKKACPPGVPLCD